MNRAGALTALQPEFNVTYESLGRTTDDTVTGYMPVIDLAMYAVGATDPSTYVVPTADDQKFRAALRYHAIRLAMSISATVVDSSVDAPLTSMKASQIMKNLKDLFILAKEDYESFGLGSPNVGWVRWNLDFQEPSDESEDV